MSGEEYSRILRGLARADRLLQSRTEEASPFGRIRVTQNRAVILEAMTTLREVFNRDSKPLVRATVKSTWFTRLWWVVVRRRQIEV